MRKIKQTSKRHKDVTSSMHPVIPIVPTSGITVHKQADSEIDSTMEKFAVLDSESEEL